MFRPNSEPGNLEIRSRSPNHSTVAFVVLGVRVKAIEISANKANFFICFHENSGDSNKTIFIGLNKSENALCYWGNYCPGALRPCLGTSQTLSERDIRCVTVINLKVAWKK